MSQLNFWSFDCFVGQNFILYFDIIWGLCSNSELNPGIKYLRNTKILSHFVSQLFIVCN